MAEPLPLPIRVLVMGSSTSVWVSWMGGPRTDLAWPRALERELLAAGRPAEVRVSAYPAAMTKAALKTWGREVIPWSPDVVILNLGEVESIHLLLPRWLRDHAINYRTRTGPVRSRYRVLLTKLWKRLAKVQTKIDGRVDPHVFRRRNQRVMSDLEHLARQIRTVGSPLVLMPDFPGPGPAFAKYFPGLPARIEWFNGGVDELIARIDHPEVRRFAFSEVIEKMDLQGQPARLDGAHYTALVHAELGRGIGHEILEWADTQPHLQLAAAPRRATRMPATAAKKAAKKASGSGTARTR